MTSEPLIYFPYSFIHQKWGIYYLEMTIFCFGHAVQQQLGNWASKIHISLTLQH